MDQKIITKLDSNQITFNMENVNPDTILKNELLIKELVMELRNRELYTSFSVGKKIDELEQLEAKLEELFSVTGVSNIYDLQELIKRLASSSLKKVEVIEKLNSTNKQLLSKVEKQGAEQDQIILQFTETKKKMTAEFEKQIVVKDESLKECEVNRQNMHSEKLELIAANNTLTDEINKLQIKVKERESTITELTSVNSELNLQLKDYQDRIEVQLKELEELQVNLEQKSNELEVSANQYEQLKNRKFNRVIDKVSRSGK